MRCPYCNKNLIIPSYAEGNMDAYNSVVKTKTNCCGKIIRAWQRRIVVAEKCEARVDDWGHESK